MKPFKLELREYRMIDYLRIFLPTAAIDPMEETRLYQQFARIAADKTSVIVTHRLGSARIADRIVVMREGVIDDIGTHDDLLARGGYYAELYQSQAKWYA